MTVGDADTPWHHQFFHAVTFEPQRLTEDSATAVTSYSLRHCDLSSMFITVDDPDTPWHPQLIIFVFEPRHLTEDSSTVRASSVPPSSHFDEE